MIKEFFVGLLVLGLILMFSVAGVLLFPLFILLGFFLKLVVAVLFLFAMIWVIGKLTLIAIKRINNEKPPSL